MLQIPDEVVTISVKGLVADVELRLIITQIPALQGSLVRDALVYVVAGSAIQGEMRLSLIESRLASARGVLWDLIQETSLAAQIDEAVAVLEPVAPKAIVVLEHFERATSCTLPPHTLSRAVAQFFASSSTLEKLGWGGAVLLTYPFPLNSYDEEAAVRIAAVYEDAWGMEAVVPGGALRKLVLQGSKKTYPEFAFLASSPDALRTNIRPAE